MPRGGQFSRAVDRILSSSRQNATYMRDGQRGETLQQLAMVRLRAIEHDRSLAAGRPAWRHQREDRNRGLSAGTHDQVTRRRGRSAGLAHMPALATRNGGWPEGALALTLTLKGAPPLLVLLPRLRMRLSRRRVPHTCHCSSSRAAPAHKSPHVRAGRIVLLAPFEGTELGESRPGRDGTLTGALLLCIVGRATKGASRPPRSSSPIGPGRRPSEAGEPASPSGWVGAPASRGCPVGRSSSPEPIS